MSGLVGALLLAAGGCRSQPPTPPPKAPKPPAPCELATRVLIKSGARLNPDDAGKPLPTLIRLYQTRRASALEDSDFVRLWESPEDVLGETLVVSQETTVYPGVDQELDLLLDPETRYMFAVGIFRQPKGKQWQSYVALPRSEELCGAYGEDGPPGYGFVLQADGYRVELASRLMGASGGDEAFPEDVAPVQESE